jgi:hypothetical protein
MKPNAFFIGWSARTAMPHRWFLIGIVLLLFGGLSGLALALGSTVNDPGGGMFTGDHTLTGVLVTQPYPVIVLDPDSEHPFGHGVLLSGGGKRGVQAEAAALAGRRVRASGYGVKRGTLDMLLGTHLEPADGEAPAPTRAALGTWRLTGEICDGKCSLGVMRPGTGLSHKACANVCVSGGVPPVLVTTAPVAGTQFLLIGDAEGHALPDTLRDHMAIPQRMDGTLERVADLLVFRTDLAAAVDP